MLLKILCYTCTKAHVFHVQVHLNYKYPNRCFCSVALSHVATIKLHRHSFTFWITSKIQFNYCLQTLERSLPSPEEVNMKCQSLAVTTEFKYRWAKRNSSQPVTSSACSLAAVPKGSSLQASAFISCNTLPFLPPQAAVKAAVTTLQAQSHQWQSLLGWRQGTGRGLGWVNTFGTWCQSRADPSSHTFFFSPQHS